MQRDPQSHDENELDRLLRQAQWPGPAAEQIARLGERWRQLARGRRRRMSYAMLGMAAGILVAVGIVAWRGIRAQPEVAAEVRTPPPAIEKREPAPEPSAVVDAETPKASDEPEREQLSTPAPGEIVREPNLYERAVMAGAAPKRAKRQALARKESRQKLVEEIVAALAADGDADVDAKLTAMERDLPRYEPLLWDAARSSNSGLRLGAVRVLARVGSARSVPLLGQLTLEPAARDAALAGLERLAAPRDLALLAAGPRAGDVRRPLLGMLLACRTEEAVALYLDFVRAFGTREDALAALVEMSNPPAELLLARLASPQETTRLTAALALSRLGDPAVVEQICAQVGGIGRQEALIALLLNSSEQAAGCLNHARHDVYLVASVRAAEQKLQLLQFSRGG